VLHLILKSKLTEWGSREGELVACCLLAISRRIDLPGEVVRLARGSVGPRLVGIKCSHFLMAQNSLVWY
jgi:hypothetical protein